MLRLRGITNSGGIVHLKSPAHFFFFLKFWELANLLMNLDLENGKIALRFKETLDYREVPKEVGSAQGVTNKSHSPLFPCRT